MAKKLKKWKDPNTNDGLLTLLKKADLDDTAIGWLCGTDYTDLLCYIRGKDCPELDSDLQAHREDIQYGPILEFDPTTGRVVAGLAEGSDTEMWPDEYATKEEIEKYAHEWRADLAGIVRVLEEDTGTPYSLEDDGTHYILEQLPDED